MTAWIAECANCGATVDTRENGTDGAELTHGRWACSEECWDVLAGPADMAVGASA